MSLELLEAFGGQVDRLAGVAETVGEAEWALLEPTDLQRSFVVFLAKTAPSLEAVQELALEYAGAYLAAAGEEVGQTVQTRPPAELRAADPFGRPVGELLGPVAGRVYLALAQGRTMAEALEIGRASVRSIAGSFVRDAARQALSSSFESSDAIVGFRWVSRGTCGACLGMDTGSTLPPGTPLEVHPNCACVAEPVFEPPPELEGAGARKLWEEDRRPWRIGLPPGAVEPLQTLPMARAQAQGLLRSGKWEGEVLETRAAVAELIAGLDEVTTGPLAYKVRENIATFRVIDEDAVALLDGLRDGAVFRDAGFTHVTVDPAIALRILRGGLSAGEGTANFVSKTGTRTLLRIHLTAGQEAAIGFADMEELLLPRGMSFRVRGRRTIPTGDGPVELIDLDVVIPPE